MQEEDCRNHSYTGTTVVVIRSVRTEYMTKICRLPCYVGFRVVSIE